MFNLCTSLHSRLEEGGATSLGPALIISSSLASHHPGSKVIVCTDGRSNIGPGKMEDESDEADAANFYNGLGDKALEAGYVEQDILM